MLICPATQPQTKPTTKRPPYFSPFQHYDLELGEQQLRQADTEYNRARVEKSRHNPARRPLETASDAQNVRLKFRPYVLREEAARFKLQALQHVKANAEALKAIRNKESVRRDRIRRERQEKQADARLRGKSLGLFDHWVEAGIRLNSARSAKAARLRSASQLAPSSSKAQVDEAERQVKKAEAAYHALVLALRRDTPGMTRERAQLAYLAATRRLRETRSKEPAEYDRIYKLQIQMDHFRYLSTSQRTAPASPTSQHRPWLRAHVHSEPLEPGTPSIAELLRSVPTPELP